MPPDPRPRAGTLILRPTLNLLRQWSSRPPIVPGRDCRGSRLGFSSATGPGNLGRRTDHSPPFPGRACHYPRQDFSTAPNNDLLPEPCALLMASLPHLGVPLAGPLLRNPFLSRWDVTKQLVALWRHLCPGPGSDRPQCPPGSRLLGAVHDVTLHARPAKRPTPEQLSCSTPGLSPPD